MNNKLLTIFKSVTITVNMLTFINSELFALLCFFMSVLSNKSAVSHLFFSNMCSPGINKGVSIESTCYLNFGKNFLPLYPGTPPLQKNFLIKLFKENVASEVF